jgi:hypothetical protein
VEGGDPLQHLGFVVQLSHCLSQQSLGSQDWNVPVKKKQLLSVAELTEY